MVVAVVEHNSHFLREMDPVHPNRKIIGMESQTQQLEIKKDIVVEMVPPSVHNITDTETTS